MAYKKDSQDIMTAIGLYDAYLSAKQVNKANRLVKTCITPGFSEGTTESPALFESMRPKSYVAIYIWNPRSDADYGHAAIKVVHNEESFYLSWFASGANYTNKGGIPRSTPASYGSKTKINTSPKAKSRLQTLFGCLPSNTAAQSQQMLMRQSDKEELRRSATFKIFFSQGIRVERQGNRMKFN